MLVLWIAIFGLSAAVIGLLMMMRVQGGINHRVADILQRLTKGPIDD